MGPSRAAAVKATWRNEEIARSIGKAGGVLKAIEQELERRGATPLATGLVARDFAFVQTARLDRDLSEQEYSSERTEAARDSFTPAHRRR